MTELTGAMYSLRNNYAVSSQCDQDYLIQTVTKPSYIYCSIQCSKTVNFVITTLRGNQCKLYNYLASIYLIEQNGTYIYFRKDSRFLNTFNIDAFFCQVNCCI